MHQWGAARYRSAKHDFSADLEHIVCIPGDQIYFQHEAIAVGIGSARVIAVDANQVQLDTSFPSDIGTNYAIQFRNMDGSIFVAAVTSQGSGSYNTFTFTAGPLGEVPDVDALSVYGQAETEVLKLLVHNISPMNNDEAKLTCFIDNPEVYKLENGTIPPWTPNNTTPSGTTDLTIMVIKSGDSVMGEDSNGVPVPAMAVTPNPVVPITSRGSVRIEMQYRQDGVSAAWNKLPLFDQSTLEIRVTAVTIGVTYNVRIRFTFGDGSFGAFDEQNHTVIGSNHTGSGPTNP
jgi:hypothetical protein